MRVPALFLLPLAVAAPAQAEDVFVAAAASMNHPLEEIIAVFERESGHTVRLTLGSSGNFYGQIANGAPFDVFLSADREYVEALDRRNLVEPGSVEIYAVGRLAVWVRADSSLEPETEGMATLDDPSVNRIAIANPRLAPYGRAAIEAMRRFGVHDRVADKLVHGDNVSQAAQFAMTGGADVGILALSLARADVMREGRYWLIPADAHAPIEQGMAILRRERSSARQDAAVTFRNMVRGPVGRSVLERYGFTVP